MEIGGKQVERAEGVRFLGGLYRGGVGLEGKDQGWGSGLNWRLHIGDSNLLGM